ncbi:MAG: T9SS type A sorting domain-containing protein [Bacteroidetes bacterium]|nr:T9SS type A sorting domain-containing protein [Bacteroidota bacterium]
MKAQAVVVEEEFNGGTTPPAGWIFTSITATLNSNSNYGKTQPSVIMDATSDQITSATFVAGTSNAISFWAQSTSGTPTTSDLLSVEFFNGSWNSCTPATFTFNTTARMYEATFPTTATRLRITYTKSTVNVAIDDFTILNKSGTCTTNSFLWFTSITYNSCNANTCEGTDEFLTFQNGSTAMNLSDLEITVPGVGAGPEGTTFCGSAVNPCDEFFTTNAAYVASLNAVAGCTGFFLSPPGNLIPANGRVIVFMGNPPSATINFGTLCSSGGNYYCVFVSNTTNCTGRYSNASTALRFTTIRNRNTGCSVERSFTPSNGVGNDGDVVAFNPSGAETYVSNGSCSGFAILPIELTDFLGEEVAEGVRLKWEVASETNTVEYIIERSTDAVNWIKIGSVSPAKSGSDNFSYQLIDESPLKGINYYRLKDIDNDGRFKTHKIISVNLMNKASDIYYTQNEESLIVSFNSSFSNAVLNLYDLTGRLVRKIKLEENHTVSISKRELQSGMYLLKCENYPQTPAIKVLVN